ncbi:hypothetical protein [Arenibaculum pallidiluteum]|uniref:hypothetical protein n=1 Tax=Arenibaculum pallidiluteum TaxID=2812559 RepID=UPI001A96418B|nr:hypothetical protein [Arenibaculum pallidiluteum]
MAARTGTGNPGVADRVEQVLARAGASLRLWMVFETAEEAAAARTLLSARKARHVEALSRTAWKAREDEAYGRLAARVGAASPPATPLADGAAPRPATSIPAAANASAPPKPAPRRRAARG